jgi:SAM-dependent methyltransferase
MWLKMRRPTLDFTGCDISEKACVDYRRLNNADCILADLTKPTVFPKKFDAVIVGGGIHHLVTDLDTAMKNIADALKSGGSLIMSRA